MDDVKERFRRIRWWLLIGVLVFAQLGLVLPAAQAAKAADNGLGAKPYMGWSSYSMQVFTGDGQWINAEQIKAQSDAMHELLQPHGYEYINVDAGWNGGVDAYGRPVPSTTLYPDGLEAVIDYVHANGQKFGLYGIPGLGKDLYEADLPIYDTACTTRDIAKQPLSDGDYWGFTYQIDFSNPCAQSYINSIADKYAEWGVDFLKFDSVTPGSGIYDLSMDARDDVKAWSEALEPHGIWLELSWAVDIQYADYWKQYANGWRVDWDVECYCEGALTSWNNIARLFPIAEQWWRHAGPGGWNDFDSLNVGNGAVDGLTQDERRTAMTFWSISAAPLYIGNDMTNLDAYGLELLTNDEVIAVQQAGRPARPVSTETEQQVWYANNGDGTYTVALFNLGGSAATVSVDWSDLGFEGEASVRDLWSHTELGTFESGFSSADLASHATRLLKVTALDGQVMANDDEAGVRYVGSWERNGGHELRGVPQPIVIEVEDAGEQDSKLKEGTAYFDKSNPSDVKTIIRRNGNQLVSIMDGEYSLTSPEDYKLAGSRVFIKEDYLQQKPAGITTLVFHFSSGQPQTLSILIQEPSVQDSTVTPTAVSFDRKATERDDLRLTLGFNGNHLIGVAREGSELSEGADYTVSGDVVTIQQDYLASLPLGMSDLTFNFDAGAERTVALAVKDSSVGGKLMLNNDDSSIAYVGNWGHSYNRGLGDYQDDVHYAEGNGEYFEYTFEGTGIEVLTELDPSQGEMEFYLDGELQHTTNTWDIGRRAQRIVYSVAGLEDGPHTIRGVKKSGVFMLLDQLNVTLPDLLEPAEASFDKAQAADIPITTVLNDLSAIRYEGEGLAAGTEYTVAGNNVALKQEFLAGQRNGGVRLTFEFAGGEKQELEVTITDSTAANSTISTVQASFDKLATAQMDVTTAVYWAGNSLSTIENRGIVLSEGLDYTVSGDEIAITKDYLAAQPVGTTKLDLHFSAGDPQQLKIAISDTTPESSRIGPEAVSIDQRELADVLVTMELNSNSLTGISDEEGSLVEGDDYELLDPFVLLKKEYLEEQPRGTTNLTFAFSTGQEQPLALVIGDSSRGRYLSFNDNDPEIEYHGSWNHSRLRGLGDYKDDVHFAEKDGDSFEFTFKGTGIEVISEKESAQGDMDIYLDGQLVQTISTHHASRLSQETVYSVMGLSYEEHTIEVVKRSGSYMLLDQLKVALPDVVEPDTAVFEKTDPADYNASMTIDESSVIGLYHGDTALVPGTDYTVSGGELTIREEYLAAQPTGTLDLSLQFRGDYRDDVYVTKANGDYVEYAFIGSGIELLTPMGPTQGEMDIYVDGVLQQTIDAYHPIRLTQQTVFSLTGLPEGLHTIKAVKTSGKNMIVDAFIIH